MARSCDDIPLDLSTKRTSVAPSPSSGSTEIVQLLTRDNRRHPCLSCGIGFSSTKTLLAHENFYCTKTPVNTALLEKPQTREPRVIPSTTVLGSTVSPSPSDVPVSTPPVADLRNNGPSSSPKDKSGHFCTHCAFRANTLRGLRSHITKYHVKEVKAAPKGYRQRNGGSRASVIVAPRRPKIDGAPAATNISGLPEKKKYCKYCDIYFKYLSTFLAHRKFYCTVRKVGADGEAFTTEVREQAEKKATS